MHGNPTQAYSRQIRVQGVVAGAFEMIKTLNISYEIKGMVTSWYKHTQHYDIPVARTMQFAATGSIPTTMVLLSKAFDARTNVLVTSAVSGKLLHSVHYLTAQVQ